MRVSAEMLGAEPSDAYVLQQIQNHFVSTGVPLLPWNSMEGLLRAFKPLFAQNLSAGAITNALYSGDGVSDFSPGVVITKLQAAAFVTAAMRAYGGITVNPYETPSWTEATENLRAALAAHTGSLIWFGALGLAAYFVLPRVAGEYFRSRK